MFIMIVTHNIHYVWVCRLNRIGHLTEIFEACGVFPRYANMSTCHALIAIIIDNVGVCLLVHKVRFFSRPRLFVK